MNQVSILLKRGQALFKTKRMVILRTTKRQLTFLGHISRKEGPENFTLTGHIEVKMDRGKLQNT